MKLHANARTCPHCRSLIVSRIIDDSQSISEVAFDFRVSLPTARKWLKRYRAQGVEGLSDKSSRPQRIPRQLLQPGKELHDAVMSLLHTPPSASGFNRTTWRMRDLRNVLKTRGIVASQNNIRRVIKVAGYRWKKARASLTSCDPDYRSKLDAIQHALANLGDDDVFFSIDEFGPVAVRMRGGKSLQGPNEQKVVPQWQKSRGFFILNAALELSKNQITYVFTEAKNTGETVRLIELLRRRYTGYRRMFLSWDAAPWHSSAKLRERVDFLNEWAPHDRAPLIQVLPLPTSAQFLNVIESVFSGLARAVLHNSDYASVEDAKVAVALYLDDRNCAFKAEPRRAGKLIWKMERVRSEFLESNNCKDLRYS